DILELDESLTRKANSDMSQVWAGKVELESGSSGLISESMPNVLGQTQYIDDITRPAGCLQAVVVLSQSAHGRIRKIHTEEALELDTSVRVILASDIPGTNQIGFNKPDEPLSNSTLPAQTWLMSEFAFRVRDSSSSSISLLFMEIAPLRHRYLQRCAQNVQA
ncbi:MAG: hypothetical protein WBJ46_09485, partial [Rectinema sp.]